MVDELQTLLRRVRDLAGPTFSGVGVLICDQPNSLALVPLRLDGRPPLGVETAVALASMSRCEDDLHDGFHVLSTDLQILRVAQYFSPPPVPDVMIDRSRPFGGRYLAAQFGSCLPRVAATGIVRRNLDLAVFQGGQLHAEFTR